MRSIQELFDTIVAHLRKQGCQAIDVNDNICLYRGPNGTSCAVGCLIPDELYNPEMETKPIIWILKECFKENNELRLEFEEHALFLGRMQHIHDHFGVSDWEKKWRDEAFRYALTYTPPEK